MSEHLCFECQHVYMRTVGEFVETNCDFYKPVRQQVDGDVKACDRFEPAKKDEE